MAHQRDGGLYERLVARSEADVRALLTELLAAHHAETHADAVFDLLVGTAVLRAVTVGLHDAAAFCDRTADALTALAYSSWRPEHADQHDRPRANQPRMLTPSDP